MSELYKEVGLSLEEAMRMYPDELVRLGDRLIEGARDEIDSLKGRVQVLEEEIDILKDQVLEGEEEVEELEAKLSKVEDELYGYLDNAD